MRKFIAILLTFAVCWGAHAITDQQVRDRLRQAEIAPDASPAQIASHLCPLLGLEFPLHKALVVNLWKGFKAGKNIDAGIAEVVKISTLNPAPVPIPTFSGPVASKPKPPLPPKPASLGSSSDSDSGYAPKVRVRVWPKPAPTTPLKSSVHVLSADIARDDEANAVTPPPPPPPPPAPVNTSSGPSPQPNRGELLADIRDGKKLRKRGLLNKKEALQPRAKNPIEAALKAALAKNRRTHAPSDDESADEEEWSEE